MDQYERGMLFNMCRSLRVVSVWLTLLCPARRPASGHKDAEQIQRLDLSSLDRQRRALLISVYKDPVPCKSARYGLTWRPSTDAAQPLATRIRKLQTCSGLCFQVPLLVWQKSESVAVEVTMPERDVLGRRGEREEPRTAGFVSCDGLPEIRLVASEDC